MEETVPGIHEEVVVEWKGPDRPFRKRGVQFYFNVALIAVVIFLILVFFREYALVAVLFSLLFVGVAMATIPPQIIEYKITNEGIHIANRFYKWDVIRDFWQTTSLRKDVIILPTTLNFPRMLVILPDHEKKPAILQALRDNTSEIDPPKQGWFDRRAQDLVKLVNFGVKDK